MCRVEQANAEEFYEVSTSDGWIKPSQILDIYRSLLPLVDNIYETLRDLHGRAKTDIVARSKEHYLSLCHISF